jgi:predicted GNAT family acetyltransferase
MIIMLLVCPDCDVAHSPTPRAECESKLHAKVCQLQDMSGNTQIYENFIEMFDTAYSHRAKRRRRQKKKKKHHQVGDDVVRN